MDGQDTLRITSNDLSQNRARGVRAFLAWLFWSLIGLSAGLIVAYVLNGGLEVVIAGRR